MPSERDSSSNGDFILLTSEEASDDSLSSLKPKLSDVFTDSSPIMQHFEKALVVDEECYLEVPMSPMKALSVLASIKADDEVGLQVQGLREPLEIDRSPGFRKKLQYFEDQVSMTTANDLDPKSRQVFEVLQMALKLSRDATVLDVIRCELESELGYSLEKMEGRKKLAKAVAGAKTFEDLEVVFNVSHHEVRHYFTILFCMLEKEGGIQGLEEILKLQSKITTWLKTTGYPEAIPNDSAKVVTFIGQLQKEYSWERLFDLSHPALPLLDDTKEFQLKIKGCTSKSDLCSRLQIHEDSLGNLGDFLREIGAAYSLYYKLACVTRDLGFLNLIKEELQRPPQASSAAAQRIYDYLTEAVEAEYHGMTRFHREALEHQVQMSMLDPSARMHFANACIGCKSMSDLAKLLNASFEDMKESYEYLGSVLMEFYDGLEGLEGMSQASKRIVNFLDKSGYPQLPIKMTKEEVKNFFSNFQKEINENYRVVVQSSVLPVNESPERLAHIMTTSKTREELASQLKTSRHDVDWMLRHGVNKYKEYSREFDLLFRGVTMAHEMGFTSLHEKSS